MILFRMLLVSFAVTLITDSAAARQSCQEIADLKLPNTTISLAATVGAGGFSPPSAATPGSSPGTLKDLPSFCRVAGIIKPTEDSDIKFEVWMPLTGWNGKYEGVGNGGWAGTITYPAMATALARGYATASTDTGHTGTAMDGSFAMGHSEKVVDFAYRATHEMTVDAKAIVASFYGKGPRLSYWSGCSTGGKQGLKEAQKYPDDYDGIIAGAPSNSWTHINVASVGVGFATLKDPASYIPPSKYPLIYEAVLEACDALDGVKDGIIENPTRCHFDPKTLECNAEEIPDCLTPPQVEAVRKIYAPTKNSRTGEEILPGLEPGSELGWAALAKGPDPLHISVDYFKYVTFKNPNWDWRTLNFDSDVALADRIDNGTINATDPNLKSFVARGGKLIMYHGWSDPNIAPLNSVNYYESVVHFLGAKQTDDFLRIFMVPGMAHCGGGEGPSVFDALGAIEQWVEHRTAPDQIIATKYVGNDPAKGIVRTRPLCPFPQQAQWKGSGTTDDATNFVCRVP